MRPKSDGSSNVIRFKPNEAGEGAPIGSVRSDDQALVDLLTALNGQSLQSVFSAMDVLQLALDRVEAMQALLPDDADIQTQRAEIARLSCELFAVRMIAVRLSATLAHLRQEPATSPVGRTADAASGPRSNAAGN
jgi:hypothetical protein